MEKNTKLTVEEIFNKEFAVDFKGYSPVEVDDFLDAVIQDYQKYEELLAIMQEKVAVLERNNAGLKAHIMELEAKQRQMKEVGSEESANSLDLLKRIARLEDAILKKND